MSKILKEPQVYVPCPACGKIQHIKLKWALKHRSATCPGCRQSVDLKAAPAKGLIARTAAVVKGFVDAMEALQGEARRDAKAFKARRKAAKNAGKKQRHAKPAKKVRRKATRSRPVEVMLPVLSAGTGQPSP